MTAPFRFIAVAAVAAGVLAFPLRATGQNYPVRPITLIVPFPAGGPTDLAMRALGEAAAKHLGQPVIVENKAGGAGTVGPATMAATGKPDGYTIAQMPVTVYRLPLMQDTTWKADDFTYIIHLTG
jgi:tripartite-type tricarboxylate transporter receptor subunit TctC